MDNVNLLLTEKIKIELNPKIFNPKRVKLLIDLILKENKNKSNEELGFLILSDPKIEKMFFNFIDEATLRIFLKMKNEEFSGTMDKWQCQEILNIIFSTNDLKYELITQTLNLINK